MLTYCNPVWDGYCADPFVLRHGDFYYAYATYFSFTQTGDTVSGGIDGRHFILLRSPDLAQWERLGGALEPIPGNELAQHWAPEVTFANGRFWMYYSTEHTWKGRTQQRLRVAVADAPEGPFRDVGKLLFPEEAFTIDASPFRDPRDGRWYLYFSQNYLTGRVGTGTAVVPLADDMITPLAAPIPVVVAASDWHVSAKNQEFYGEHYDLWHTVEGAHVVYKNDRYYCFYSGGCWEDESYGVAYAVADHPLGPWTDEWSAAGATVLRGVPNHIVGPGHNSIVLAPDGVTHMCIYHAWNESHTMRQLCIDPVVWTPDGPHVTPSWGAQRPVPMP